MINVIQEGLTFDDVLLIPKHSTVGSRSKIDLSVKIGNLSFEHPIIPANMKAVTGKEMAQAVMKSGGLAIVHRFMTIAEQVGIASDLIKNDKDAGHLGFSIGVKANDKEYVDHFVNVGVNILCIDIAHGDSQHCAEMASWIKSKYPKVCVIAGNIATRMGACDLWRAGADIIKVGVGPGSLCTTRIETGNGVPQLTALMEAARAKENMIALYKSKSEERQFTIIADGGIKNAGDVVKALCFADMVMIGNVFAGCVETPGSILTIDGRNYKEYAGSSTHKTNHIEGVVAIVPTKGTFDSILTKTLEGLRSGCSYQGAHNLAELKNNPTFIKITNAGLKESNPHDVIVR